MNVLVVVPDYASHWYPLSAVASALRARRHTVVVATGSALGPRVAADGYARVALTLGSGSNAGVGPRGGESELDAFFAASRGGIISTLTHQAMRRRHDLLWQPDAVATRLSRIVDEIAPDAVLVDQLAFGATAALRGLGVPFVSFLPGHPCQLPGPGDLFGFPGLRPPMFEPPAVALESLHRLCSDVTREFTASYNAATTALDPSAPSVDDAFAAGGTAGTLVNYPAQLGTHTARLPQATFIGSCIRNEPADLSFARLAAMPRLRPRAYVSLGSFLSARGDVLGRIADAVRRLGWDAVVATGASDPVVLGTIPPGWVVGEHLPQIAAMKACDVVVCHGGNNTVTEALTSGLPLLTAPFSTDQFAGAEDIRRAGLGEVIDPNGSSPAEIADALHAVHRGGTRDRAHAIGVELRRSPGAAQAAAAVEASAALHPAAA